LCCGVLRVLLLRRLRRCSYFELCGVVRRRGVGTCAACLAWVRGWAAKTLARCGRRETSAAGRGTALADARERAQRRAAAPAACGVLPRRVRWPSRGWTAVRRAPAWEAGPHFSLSTADAWAGWGSLRSCGGGPARHALPPRCTPAFCRGTAAPCAARSRRRLSTCSLHCSISFSAPAFSPPPGHTWLRCGGHFLLYLTACVYEFGCRGRGLPHTAFTLDPADRIRAATTNAARGSIVCDILLLLLTSLGPGAGSLP